LIGSAASDIAGFSVIALSPMGLFSNFGIYSAAMIALSLVASLVLTTAALGILAMLIKDNQPSTSVIFEHE
jgi:predicted RND superfamily exporter protein